MKTILAAALALGTLSTATLASEPLTLTDEQMGKVVAGARPDGAGQGVTTASQLGGAEPQFGNGWEVANQKAGFNVGRGTATANQRP